jgi:hypothetical protein
MKVAITVNFSFSTDKKSFGSTEKLPKDVLGNFEILSDNKAIRRFQWQKKYD